VDDLAGKLAPQPPLVVLGRPGNIRNRDTDVVETQIHDHSHRRNGLWRIHGTFDFELAVRMPVCRR
jgi:hypothetical protein